MNETFVVTDGVHLYAVERDWARLPAGRTLGPLSDVAVAPDGEIVAAQRERPALLVFGPDGTFRRAIDHPGLASVHRVAFAPDGRLFVTTWDAHQVLAFDRAGTLVLELGERHRPRWNAPFNHPTDVAVAEDGAILVADGYGNSVVHRFDADGAWIETWGGTETFGVPHALAFAGPDRLLVADRDADRIVVLDPADGTIRDVWDKGFVHPMDLWASPEGRIYVVDQTPRLHCLDPWGEVIGRARVFGTYTHGIAGGTDGHLYGAEQGPSSVTRFRRLGPA